MWIRLLIVIVPLWALVACSPPAAPAAPIMAPTATASVLPTMLTTTPRPAVPPTMTPYISPVPPATATPAPDGWVSFDLNLSPTDTLILRHPEAWEVRSGDTETFSIVEMGPLKLFIFGTLPIKNTIGVTPHDVCGELYTSASTFACFRESLTEGATIVRRVFPSREVEIIGYETVRYPVIVRGIKAPGTVALWRQGERNFALFDEGNTQQSNGVFDRVLESFSYRTP